MVLAGTAAPKKAKKGKKQRKVGRNANFCKLYRLSHKRERNKLKRLEKHLRRFPDDISAQKAVACCKAVI